MCIGRFSKELSKHHGKRWIYISLAQATQHCNQSTGCLELALYHRIISVQFRGELAQSAGTSKLLLRRILPKCATLGYYYTWRCKVTTELGLIVTAVTGRKWHFAALYSMMTDGTHMRRDRLMGRYANW
jgi:hypothetical protein